MIYVWALCVLTVWSRDMAFIRTQTSEPPAFIRSRYYMRPGIY